jgi:SAM-dependent methyltransferase
MKRRVEGEEQIETYFIKKGYQINPRTRVEDSFFNVEYWTPKRIRLAGSYQFHVYQEAQRLLRQHRYESLLDVGCGPAAKVRELIWPVCKNVVLVDHPSSGQIVSRVLPQARFVGIDLEEARLDLRQRFDIIICSDVIEHLVDPDPCLRFIRDHLSDRGLAILSTPERDIVRGPASLRPLNPEHVREWNAAEFARYIASRGFEVVRQELYPQLRMPGPFFSLTQKLRPKLLGAKMLGELRARWFGNQVVICRRAS